MTTIRRIRPLPLALIALAAIAALVLIPWAVQAQTPSVLTSNTGVTPYASDEVTTSGSSPPVHVRSLHGTSEFAQRFTTGTDTNGYTLTSVGIDFETIHDTSVAGAELEMTIRTRSTRSGAPDDVVCTLDDPATFTASGVQTFTVPSSCPNLDHNPVGGNSGHYYVVLKRVSDAGFVFVHRTATVDRANSGAWAVINNGIAHASRFFSWTDCPCQYMIEITGHRVGGI